MAGARVLGQGLLFTDEASFYCRPVRLDSTAAMDPAIDASETLGFPDGGDDWVTVVVQTGWREKFPGSRRRPRIQRLVAALILARSSNFSNLFAFQRDNRLIRIRRDVQ